MDGLKQKAMSDNKNLEQVKLELTSLETTVKMLNDNGIPVPATVSDAIEKLRKRVAGNSSEQTSRILNEVFAAKVNDFSNPKTAELREALVKAVAGKTRVSVIVETAEDGTQTIKFDVAGTGGGSGQSTGNGGGTRGDAKYNSYEVVCNEGVADKFKYPASSFKAEGQSGKATLRWILNNGANPMNLPATYGDGASANKTLETLAKNDVFKANFAMEMKHAEAPAATTATAEATAPATTEGEGQE